jgi:hypothetical protein
MPAVMYGTDQVAGFLRELIQSKVNSIRESGSYRSPFNAAGIAVHENIRLRTADNWVKVGDPFPSSA